MPDRHRGLRDWTPLGPGSWGTGPRGSADAGVLPQSIWKAAEEYATDAETYLRGSGATHDALRSCEEREAKECADAASGPRASDPAADNAG